MKNVKFEFHKKLEDGCDVTFGNMKGILIIDKQRKVRNKHLWVIEGKVNLKNKYAKINKMCSWCGDYADRILENEYKLCSNCFKIYCEKK